MTEVILAVLACVAWASAYAYGFVRGYRRGKRDMAKLLRRGGGDVTPWLVFAAKRNGVMQ